MNLEALRILRNVLLRAFAIGAGITLLYAAATLLGWRTWVSLFTERWHVVDAATFGIIALGGLTLIRFFIIFVLLVPGLAIHWTLVRERRRERPR